MLKSISVLLIVALATGCATPRGVYGPAGPRLVGASRSTETERYVEVGLQFSSAGDLVALVSPKRWRSPLKTGGSLSWVNPTAWSDDPGRTGRILVGGAVIVGGVIAATAVAGSGGSSDGGNGASLESRSNVPAANSPPQVPLGRPR